MDHSSQPLIEVFGYTADIFEGSTETEEIVKKTLVRVNHKHSDQFDVLVDRSAVYCLSLRQCNSISV